MDSFDELRAELASGSSPVIPIKRGYKVVLKEDKMYTSFLVSMKTIGVIYIPESWSFPVTKKNEHDVLIRGGSLCVFKTMENAMIFNNGFGYVFECEYVPSKDLPFGLIDGMKIKALKFPPGTMFANAVKITGEPIVERDERSTGNSVARILKGVVPRIGNANIKKNFFR